jgi:peptidyl-prolyl cis-trans isomerase C
MRSRSPPWERRCARGGAAALLGLFVAVASPGRGNAPQAATSPVVAKVGTVTITIADLERRLAAVPPFQLRSFGTTPAEIRREFLDRVVVREALLAQGGADRGLEARDDVRERVRGVLRTALLNRLRGEVATAAKFEEADIKAYYEKNASRFHTPERYALWIIATNKREEAMEIIADMKKDPSPKHWAEIARTRSVDGATAMRGGNLGFVLPDGTTPEPGLKVSRDIIATAQKLKDTEIASEPVKDAGRWVIVWRKQTMAAVDRSIDVEAGSIKQMLLHMRTDAKIKDTVAGLRREHLHDHNPDLVDLFDITPQGDLSPVRRPGSLPVGRRAPVNPVPAPGTLR